MHSAVIIVVNCECVICRSVVSMKMCWPFAVTDYRIQQMLTADVLRALLSAVTSVVSIGRMFWYSVPLASAVYEQPVFRCGECGSSRWME